MMEPEWIPRVMVECANAPLPVEVTRVRVNPDMSGVGFETSAIGGGRGGMMGRGGPQMPRGLSGMMDLGGMGQGSVGKQLAQVEIHGVVFIYNQPDQDELPVVEGVEIEEESAAEEVASADGETNAG